MPATHGIDFGTSLVKFMHLDGESVKSAAVVPNATGTVTWESEKDVLVVKEMLKKNLAELKWDDKKINLVLPDSAVYMSVINMPILSDTELSSAIQWEAEQYVPIPLADVELSWEVLDRPTKKTGSEKMPVLLVAAKKKTVQSWMDVLLELGLEPESIEPEFVASARAHFFGAEPTGNVAFAVIGASGMTLGVFREGKLMFTSQLSAGGMALTRAIAQGLQLQISQAEEYKKTYGVKGNVLEQRLILAMEPVLNVMVSEIKRVQSYFEQLIAGEKLTRLVITGGTAMMPGLISYLTEKTALEVVVAEPFKKIKAAENVALLAPVYGAVLGTLIKQGKG